MFYIIILLMALICLFSYFCIEKKVTSPAFIFSFEWLIFVFFYHFNGLGYNEVSEKTYAIIMVGVLSYVFGAAIVKNKRIRYVEPEFLENKKNSDATAYNVYLLYTLLGIALLYCVWKFSQMGIALVSGNMNFGAVRLTWLGEGGLQNAREETIYNCLILPGLYTNIIVAALNFSLNKVHKIQTIMTAICVALVVLFSGARMILIDIIVAVFFGVLLAKRRFSINISKKRKFILIFACVALLIALERITQERQGANIFQVAIGNFTLSIPLLDYVVKMSEANHDITYGMISIRGIMSLPLIILAMIGIDLWPIQYKTLSKYTNPFFPIGRSTVANAYVTTFFYFWLDGRWIGVVVMSIIFGALTQKIYYKAKTADRKTDRGQLRIALYLFSLLPVWRTFFNFSYSNTTFTITFILLFFVYNGIRFKIGNRRRWA